MHRTGSYRAAAPQQWAVTRGFSHLRSELTPVWHTQCPPGTGGAQSSSLWQKPSSPWITSLSIAWHPRNGEGKAKTWSRHSPNSSTSTVLSLSPVAEQQPVDRVTGLPFATGMCLVGITCSCLTAVTGSKTSHAHLLCLRTFTTGVPRDEFWEEQIA